MPVVDSALTPLPLLSRLFFFLRTVYDRFSNTFVGLTLWRPSKDIGNLHVVRFSGQSLMYLMGREGWRTRVERLGSVAGLVTPF